MLKTTELYQAIFKRKSIRKYSLQELDQSALNDISNYLNNIKHLYPDINVEMRIVSLKEISNLLPIKAPHYIIVSSETKEGYLTNVGFMLEQIDLFLSSNNLGSCWVGMAKPTKSIKINPDKEFVIALAFGIPAEIVHRASVLEFKRKKLKQIRNISSIDDLLECARLAPSAINSQPWYFQVSDNNIHVYCVSRNIITALILEKMNKIDMGIAICHLWVGIKHLGKDFELFNDLVAKQKHPKGYYYIASLNLNKKG